MDIDAIRLSLCDTYPQWTKQLQTIEIEDSLGAVADNDGRRIFYNSRILQYYTPELQTYHIARQLLHIQFNHLARTGDRDIKIWKRACDAVVDGMLIADGFTPPHNIERIPEAEGKSAEELYTILLDRKDPDKEDQDGENEELTRKPKPKRGMMAGKDGEAKQREIDEPGLAAIINGLAEMLEPSMQLDFDWFPGTTIRDGVIHDDFRAYPVSHAEILLDTSASVDAELLRAFVRGVKGLLQQDAVLRVGCFDTRFYGFQDILSEDDIQNLSLNGFGGTDFTVAVEAFTGDAENKIIFTDGFAEMPEMRSDVVWICYGNTTIHPKGGRVLYVKPTEEKEKYEIDFLIT